LNLISAQKENPDIRKQTETWVSRFGESLLRLLVLVVFLLGRFLRRLLARRLLWSGMRVGWRPS
jgi:hypothetical protein